MARRKKTGQNIGLGKLQTVEKEKPINQDLLIPIEPLTENESILQFILRG